VAGLETLSANLCTDPSGYLLLGCTNGHPSEGRSHCALNRPHRDPQAIQFPFIFHHSHEPENMRCVDCPCPERLFENAPPLCCSAFLVDTYGQATETKLPDDGSQCGLDTLVPASSIEKSRNLSLCAGGSTEVCFSKWGTLTNEMNMFRKPLLLGEPFHGSRGRKKGNFALHGDQRERRHDEGILSSKREHQRVGQASCVGHILRSRREYGG
jgi:hypothetical protein